MRTRKMRMDQVGPDIQRIMRQGMGSASRKKVNRMIIGPTMVTMAVVAFLEEKGPENRAWRSGAKVTKHGGRWSEAYDVRPSGAKVTADKTRNLDKGELANSHTVIKADARTVKVGPGTRGKGGKARKIMEREAGYGNLAVGWDARRRRVVAAELRAFHRDIAEGRQPRYLPRSRVRTRV